MSRIGFQPIKLPSGVTVAAQDGEVSVKGPKGELAARFHQDMGFDIENNEVRVKRPSDERDHKALHGLTRSLLANMVKGVSEGFTRSLDLVGVGYRVQQTGQGITLNVMLSHQVEVQPKPGVTIEVEGQNKIHVRGIDKQVVGQTAAEIRGVRPPNAYTGKGIRYSDEQVRLKPGKSARRAG